MSDNARNDSAQDDAQPAAEAQAEAEPATAAPADASAEPHDGDMPDLDDVKRHFREALDRKNKAGSKDSSAASGKSKGKAQVAHGPSAARAAERRAGERAADGTIAGWEFQCQAGWSSR